MSEYKELLARLEAHKPFWVGGMPLLQEAADAIRKQALEIDALKDGSGMTKLAEQRNEAYRQIERLEQEVEDLAPRWDANRKDARRYRWLRTGNEHVSVEIEDNNEEGWTGVFYSSSGELLDARIDEVTQTAVADISAKLEAIKP